MKTYITSTSLIVALTILAGCATPQKGVAYNHQQEFRQQLDDSALVTKYGYTVKDLWFSPDYKEALVVFAKATNAAEPEIQFNFSQDKFGIYRGSFAGYFTNPSSGPATTPENIVIPQK